MKDGAGHFDHLMIAQDNGSAIVGPARADIFWGAGDRAAQLASHVHQSGNFAMLVPRELDPVAAGARMPLPPQKPTPPPAVEVRTRATKPTAVQSHQIMDGTQQIKPKRSRVPFSAFKGKAEIDGTFHNVRF